MADDRQDRGPSNRSRVDVSEDYELRYWTKDWALRLTSLKSAVQKVGPSVKAVREHLGR